MKRIVVVGKSGSGKSVFSDKLSKATEIPVYHLDKLYYNPDWSLAQSREDFTKIVGELILSDEWIIDGNYSRTMGARVEKADTIVFFDTPWWRSIYYVLKRALIPDKNAPDKHENMKEKISLKLFKQILTYPTRKVVQTLNTNKEARLFIVKNHAEADTLLLELI